MPVKVKYSDELYHHGILGQKWGIRRFQNPDGSLTPEGRLRYRYVGDSGKTREITGKKYSNAKKASKILKNATNYGQIRKAYALIDNGSTAYIDIANEWIRDSYFKDYKKTILPISKKVADYRQDMEKNKPAEFRRMCVQTALADALRYGKGKITGYDLAKAYVTDEWDFCDKSIDQYIAKRALTDDELRSLKKADSNYRYNKDEVYSLLLDGSGMSGIMEDSGIDGKAFYRKLSRLWEEAEDSSDPHGYRYVGNKAVEAINLTSDDIKRFDAAGKMLKKLDGVSNWSDGYSGSYKVEDAIWNLGLGDKNIDEFTEADWNRIRSRINGQK